MYPNIAASTAQFDLRLVEPASMLGSVMDLQPIPKIAALLFAVVADQRLAAVDIEVIHDEVDLPGEGVLLDDVPHPGERTRRRNGRVSPW